MSEALLNYEDIGRAALLVISATVLAELLQLPKGCHIDAATTPHDQPGVLQLRVRGCGWPIKEGTTLPMANGTMTRIYADDGSFSRNVIDWGLPT